MKARINAHGWVGVVVCVGAVILVCSSTAHAQDTNSWQRFDLGPVDRGDPFNKLNQKKPPRYGSQNETANLAEPYEGQLYCPVTGTKLGLKETAVPVQTSIGEKKPGFVAGLFGKKPTPGTVIYVCCPACVEKVRANPQMYLSQVIADKAALSSRFTYATAPAQRPYEVGESKTTAFHQPEVRPVAHQASAAQ
jgi:hypothetical protein